MKYARHNPIMNVPYSYRNKILLDPFDFQYQLGMSINKALERFQQDLSLWLGKYGLDTRGYTFITRKDYRRKLKRQFGRQLENKVPEKFFDCDGAILITDSKHANLARILLLDGWDTTSLEKIANIYWDNFDFPETEEELNARMQIVLQLLRYEFDSVAHNRGFYVSQEASPFIFKPKDKYHYPAVNYRVIPVYAYIRAYIRRVNAVTY